MSLSLPNNEVAASSLPSPPGAKTPSSNPVHAFFTPRRPLSSIGPNSRSSRVHLLSPEESPSRRCSKRARLSPSSSFSRDSPSSPIQSPESYTEPELTLVEPRKRIQSSMQQRLFMRSLHGARYGRGFHCADWSSEAMKFYSRPEDAQPILSCDDRGEQSLPFSTVACNRSSLVAVGDESGLVRLIESAKDEKPGFIVPYLSFQCHDNAIFDMSWSPDDHHLATASGDQSCRIFDVTRRQQLFILRHHQNSVKQVSYNPLNPSILASSARDGILNFWDLRVAGTKISEGRDIVTVLQPVCSVYGGHQSGRKSNSVTAVAWLDEHRIATASESDAIIKTWDLRSSYIRRKKPLPVETSELPPQHSLPAHRNFGINSLTVSPDNQRIYAVCKDSNVYTYSTNHLSQGPIHAYSHPRLHAETFYVKSDISRDGKFLSTGSSDGVAVVFPTDEKYFDKSIAPNFTYTPGSHPLANHMKVGKGVALVRGHDKEVTDMTWTMDGDLVTLSDNYYARCWRQGDKGEEVESLRDGGEDGGRRWGWGWAEKGNGQTGES
ncbi:WD40 repeat-like protein [Wilcoxina mikolae CBS 423.85]|nr:WD40 repeat-like protein [Wilcoxina mikolae CBS 423.85]